MEEKKANKAIKEDIIEIEDTRPEYLKKRVLVPSITGIIFLILGIFYGIHNIYYKSTDDAFIEGNIITVAPRVSGLVLNLNIEDNQDVKKGDLLLEIDPNDYQAKLREKKAELEEAKASLIRAENEVTKSLSDLDFAQNDYERYSKMKEKGISSKQDYEASLNKLTNAQSNNNAAKAKYNEIQYTIKRLEAEVEQEELNLSYTKIYATTDGKITNRSVEQGNYIQTAQPLFAIVPAKVWVIANFKETQLANMKPGQPVKIKIDTYGHKKFKGKVDSIQRSTGAKASLFPPENAVGSYVKIVQRVPVKITFDEDISEYNIVPGMSVVPEVKVK
ncbi:TPA: HlyD family secretion protein [Candidatus Avigastranaerophilus faecigallinarum]|nr:HlyD family secretion protein [Candidatus Avigastranaerophilus faecigallinarum]